MSTVLEDGEAGRQDGEAVFSRVAPDTDLAGYPANIFARYPAK